MPAISFQERWLDPLLRSDKQQTTRAQTDRYKVGDIVSVYNQQRGRITDKPLRETTSEGRAMLATRLMSNAYPGTPALFDRHDAHRYYAHFLGKVKLDAVYDIRPCEMSGEEIEAWAWADGFNGFHPTYPIFTKGVHADDGANMWFQRRYGDDWMRRTWTVLGWHGWVERYFEPKGAK